MSYIIDIIILLCLGWGAYKGFKNGFIIQSFAIFALALGIWAGFTFSRQIEPLLENMNINPLACSIVSFIIVFFIVLILVYVSRFLITKIASATALGLINRLAGAAFGIFANALILSIIILFLTRINNEKQFIESTTIDKTFLCEPIGKVAPAVLPKNTFKGF